MKKVNNKEYEKALEIVELYEAETSNKFVHNRTCCICKVKDIKAIEPKSSPLSQESGMWSGGTVERISFGYGSIHDMKQFYVAICDSCIEMLEKDGCATDIEKLRKEINK